MAKSTKFKKGEYAIQINAPMDNCLVKILDTPRDGAVWHEHLNSNRPDTGIVNEKFIRRATKKEILIHAVRKEY
jgi:hypothetical protein